jgi:4-hydroxybenzoate polyprenyltransferase
MMASIQKYLELVRFSHTIFALPFALGSMLLAADGVPSLLTFIQILLAMVFCRNTAMAFNRVMDAEIDGLNPRTKNRHIPKGLLSKAQVWGFILLNAFAFVLVTAWINSLAFALSVPTLFVVCFYSVVKRFSWTAQLFLGLALGFSPVGAWIAVQGSFHILPVLLGLVLLFWVAGFDTIYATQDYQFDKEHKLHSLVTRWGIQGSLRFAMALHGLMLLCLGYLGWAYQLGYGFLLTWLLVAVLVIRAHGLKEKPSLEGLNQNFFLVNGSISLIVFLGIAQSVFIGW